MNKLFLRKVLFNNEFKPGRRFDLFIAFLIIFNITVLILESVESYTSTYGDLFFAIEALVTIIFTLEYATRVFVSKNRKDYIFSFYGIVDFLSIVPFFAMIFFSGVQALATIRILRLFRLLRLFKLFEVLHESQHLLHALRASAPKIGIFILSVLFVSVIFGSALSIVERDTDGFENIPRAIYFSIITITTVGYGDIVTQTPLGMILTSLLILVGYGIIAVPTGVVTIELINQHRKSKLKVCSNCNFGNDKTHIYCCQCGSSLKA